MTIRMGLTQTSEFQLLFDVYRDVVLSDKTAGTQVQMRGIGDTTLRYKYNFVGNDGADVALAGIVFAKLPTNADHLGNNAVEGGVELPFQFNFDDGWSVSGMTQLNILKEQNTTARNYYIGYVNVVGIGKSLTDSTSAFAELYTFLPDTSSRNWQNTVDFGLSRMLNSNLEIDTAINLGVTKAAPNVQMQVGISYRF